MYSSASLDLQGDIERTYRPVRPQPRCWPAVQWAVRQSRKSSPETRGRSCNRAVSKRTGRGCGRARLDDGWGKPAPCASRPGGHAAGQPKPAPFGVVHSPEAASAESGRWPGPCRPHRKDETERFRMDGRHLCGPADRAGVEPKRRNPHRGGLASSRANRPEVALMNPVLPPERKLPQGGFEIDPTPLGGILALQRGEDVKLRRTNSIVPNEGIFR